MNVWLLWWLFNQGYVEAPLGRVADFCPVCRFVKPFTVVRVEKAGHVQARGEPTLLLRRCFVCRVELPYDPSRYRAMVTIATTDLGALIAETFPTIQQTLAPRLALEQRVREAPHSLSAAERQDLIREALSLVASKAKTDRGGRDARDMTLWVLAACFLSGMFAQYGAGIPELAASIQLGVVAGGVAIGASRYHGASQQRLRAMLPLLAEALRPLEPSREELALAIATLPAEHGKLAAHVGAARIEAEIASPPQAMLEGRGPLRRS